MGDIGEEQPEIEIMPGRPAEPGRAPSPEHQPEHQPAEPAPPPPSPVPAPA